MWDLSDGSDSRQAQLEVSRLRACSRLRWFRLGAGRTRGRGREPSVHERPGQPGLCGRGPVGVQRGGRRAPVGGANQQVSIL